MAKILHNAGICNFASEKEGAKPTFANTKLVTKRAASLDTLAQPCTFGEDEDFCIVTNTDINDKPALLKRARRKFLTDHLVFALVRASEQNDKSILAKSYWNTYHCAKTLQICSNGKVAGKYCKNRWCMVCNSIRTAQLINKYKPILDSWECKYLVTLTVPNCNGDWLPEYLRMMCYYFAKIKQSFYRQYKRGKLPKFTGIRKLECTYNPKANSFHPHFHLIVNDKALAELLIEKWLKHLHYAKRPAQDVRKANANACMELFKYFTKVVSGGSKTCPERKVYADAMDTIFNAMRGRRVFQPFGMNVSAEAQTDSAVDISEVIDIAQWDTALADWYSMATGEALTNYTPSGSFRDLVERKIIVRKDYTPHKCI